jgi:hypothetical protein
VGTRRITVGERRARLARRHRLVPSTRTDDVASIADSVVALHSSDPVSVFLSALARMRHPSIAAVEAAGATVAGVVAIVDREEGGAEALKKYPFYPLFKAKDLL